MKKKLDGFDNIVIEQLKDPGFATEYLRENWEYQGSDKLELLLQALHRIALARGITNIARKSGVSRRNLYKVFSGTGNPSAKTLLSLMTALNVKLSIDKAHTHSKPTKKPGKTAA